MDSLDNVCIVATHAREQLKPIGVLSVLWNIASSFYTDNFKLFHVIVRKDDFIKQLDFNTTSIQTQRKSLTNFKFY